MIVGTIVKMSDGLKQRLKDNKSGAHVKEFGEAIGVIVDKPSNVKNWPEVAVEWGNTGLRYLYLPEDLVEVKSEIKE